MSNLIRWMFFNLRYLGKPPWDSEESPPELIDFIAHNPAGKALDLGCGTGTNLVTLALAGWKVCGVDFIWLPVLKARKRLKKVGIKNEVYCRDVVNIDFINQKYDLILDIGCYHGLSKNQKERYQKNLGRLLRYKGSFLIYAYLQQESHNFGFSEEDFTTLGKLFPLKWRKDGIGRFERPSAWMQFVRD